MTGVATALDYYTPQILQEKAHKLEEWLSTGIEPSVKPKAFLLGGQSGAGKTTLHKVCRELLGQNVIVINGDEYRRLHPRFQEIQAQFGTDAPAHTARWAGEMTEALIEAFSAQGYHLIIEGTLRTSEVPLKTGRALVDRGYAVSLAVMAVKPEISLLSCQIRYELMRLAGTTPRATDPAHHNQIVHDIVDNLAVLEESGLFESIFLYNRAQECLYPIESDDRSASEVLRAILFGVWTTEEERHYETLRAQLRELSSS